MINEWFLCLCVCVFAGMEPWDVFFLCLGVAGGCLALLTALVLVGEHRDEEEECVAAPVSSVAVLPNLSGLATAATAEREPLMLGAALGAAVAAPRDGPRRERGRPGARWWCGFLRLRRRYRAPLIVFVVLAIVAAVFAGTYVLRMEGTKVAGVHGFEWTERYGTIVECGGETLLSTRMRYLGRGKYVAVVRRENDTEARVLWDYPEIGYNPTLFCMDDTPHLIGSANVEVHINMLVSAPATGRIHTMNLHTRELTRVDVDMSTCTDEVFPQCGLDSKFSVMPLHDRDGGGWASFIRANPVVGGGGRFVQTTRSVDGRGNWSDFSMLSMAGVTPSRTSNLYFMDVYVLNATHYGARFPAVFGEEGGVFETSSEDGYAWAPPRLVRTAVAFGERTTLHPVGGGGAMRINLHMDSEEVALYRLSSDGGLSLDERFGTVGTSFPAW